MARNFDDLLPEDHTFTVRGETFTWRDISAYAFGSMLDALGPSNGGEEPADAGSLAKQLEVQTEKIMLFLVPEDHERFKKLVEREDSPVTFRQLNAIFNHLVEEQTDRPTETPSPSGTGRGRTGASSKGGSR